MTDPIKATIIELCPDVMELKFGCQVELNTMPNYPMNFAELSGDENELGILFYGSGAGGGAKYVKRTNFKIVGSYITLSVVLRAIQKARTYPDKPYQPDVSIGIDDIVNIHWNLEQDNYDQQSEECKQFIGGLLNV